MSANSWTPTALASEFVGWEGSGSRAVEAQHRVATMGLVHGSVVAQALLEDILEEAKPVLPPEVGGLHWLLATPFRNRPLPGGSRFRRREDPGVFYGAEERETACAEAGYWRLKFWNESAFLGRNHLAVFVGIRPHKKRPQHAGFEARNRLPTGNATCGTRHGAY